MIVKLLTEHHFEFRSLKEDCRGLSESTHAIIQHCWKSHALAKFQLIRLDYFIWLGLRADTTEQSEDGTFINILTGQNKLSPS